MSIQLRQICLVAESLSDTIEDLKDVLGIQSCFVDEAVEKWGLENNLLSIGNNFIEVVSPTRDGTAAGRYLNRRRGDGGYMIICQADSHQNQLEVKERASKSGIRIAWEREHAQYHILQLHPADMLSAFLEVDWDENNDFNGNWVPAGGPDWTKFVNRSRTLDFCGIELQCENPDQLSKKWAHVLGVEAVHNEIVLNNAKLRFIALKDDRGPGLCGIDLLVHDKKPLIETAQRRDLEHGDSFIEICGVRFHLLTSKSES